MFLNEFVNIFSEIGWVAGILLFLGMAFCIIEIFIPGVGFFGISGSVMVVAGIIARAVAGASLTQVLIMILLFLGVLFLIFIVMILFAKYGFGRGSLVERGTAISKNYFKEDKRKLSLIGKIGIAKTELNLGGIIVIDGAEYEARTLNNFIPQGCKVEVAEINENEIIVKRII